MRLSLYLPTDENGKKQQQEREPQQQQGEGGKEITHNTQYP